MWLPHGMLYVAIYIIILAINKSRCFVVTLYVAILISVSATKFGHNQSTTWLVWRNQTVLRAHCKTVWWLTQGALVRAATIVAAPIRSQYSLNWDILREMYSEMAGSAVDPVKVIDTSVQEVGAFKIKGSTIEVILCFASFRDVFAVLPTGFGKTLCNLFSKC